MSIDPTLPLWGIIGYVIATLLAVAGFVFKMMILQLRVMQLEKEMVELKEKISLVEYGQKLEVNKIQESIDAIKESFHDLNLNLRLLIGEKPTVKNQP